MDRRGSQYALTVIVVVGFLAGCQQPAQDTQASKGPPPRPAELDRLSSWAGNWTVNFEMTVYAPQGPKKSSHAGKEVATWSCDNHYLMTTSEYDLGEMGTMKGVSMMTWDAGHKRYRNWWFDNMGELGKGWTDYCEKSHEWCLTTTGHNMATDEHTIGHGTMKMTDDNTIEWTWCECEKTLLGCKKTMEMKGTSKRG